MSKPPPPDFSRGWAGSKWFDPEMTPEERADVEAIVAGVGMYVPRPPPGKPKRAGPETPAVTRPEPKPAPPAKRGGKKRRDDGPMLF